MKRCKSHNSSCHCDPGKVGGSNLMPGGQDPFARLAMTAVLGLGLLLIGCAREEIASDQEPPPVPQFIPRGADTLFVKQGIDAVPEGDFIDLSWLPSEADDLGGYRIYRRAEDSADVVPPELVVDLTTAQLAGDIFLSYVDNGDVLFSDSSAGFFYWVSAYDESGNESAPSESAYFRLMKKADLQAPLVVADTLQLSWNYTGDPFEVDYFVVRLFRQQGGVWTPFWLYKYNVYFPAQVDYVGVLAGGAYRYQVGVVGASPPDRPSGSEAAWQFDIP